MLFLYRVKYSLSTYGVLDNNNATREPEPTQ